MKNILKFVTVVLCAVLLCACGEKEGTEVTQPPASDAQTTAPSAPTEPQNSAQTTLPPYEPDESKYDVVPLEKKDFALVYDRRCSMDVYPSYMSGSYPITILSRSEVDIDTIQVHMEDCQDYQVTILPQSLDLDYQIIRDSSNINYNPYVYQTQRGVDWKTAGDLLRTDRETALIYEANKTGENQAISLSAQEAFNAYTGQYLQEYEQEWESYIEAAPYVYEVRVDFNTCELEQVINRMSLEVEGQTYDLEVGEIRLHPSAAALFDGAEPNWDAMEEALPLSSVHVEQQLWSDGHGHIDGSFLAMEDLTLTGLEFAGTTNMTATSIRITRTTEQGQTMESLWDGTSPFYVDKGDKIAVYIEYYDPDLEGRAVCCNVFYIGIRFLCQGIESVWSGYVQDDCSYNRFDLAAVYLDGLDLRSYYLYYLNQWEFYIRSGV